MNVGISVSQLGYNIPECTTRVPGTYIPAKEERPMLLPTNEPDYDSSWWCANLLQQTGGNMRREKDKTFLALFAF